MWPRIAVIGSQFGDEGKGRVVDYLCSRADAPLVVRFSGGHQAAHRVQLEDGRSHVFAHFGSGTFRGAPTYWSYHCPVNPMAMLTEFGVLLNKDVKPKLYIDRRCPITTPFEIAMNAYRNDRRGSYDSCGVGIYETYKREKDGYHLLMEDVEFPEVFEKKVRQLEGYHDFSVPEQEINNFLWVMKNFFGPHKGGDPAFRECVSIRDDFLEIHGYETLIFEGSQGLLLDQTYGFFPHVTPSNTGTQNILEMGWKDFQVVLVTRAYQTRHGDGPMARESSVVIPDNPHEQNFDEGPQGKFRKAILDLDMLRYGVMKDRYLRYHSPVLAVTCLDVVWGDFRLIEGGALVEYPDVGAFAKRLREALKAEFVIMSDSPSGDFTGGAHITPGWQ
jgi:adenylosuccinate synthase